MRVLLIALLLAGCDVDLSQYRLGPDQSYGELVEMIARDADPEKFKAGPKFKGDGTFHLGLLSLHFPWQGDLVARDFDLSESEPWTADFDFTVDLHRAWRYADELEELYVVVVGEPVYRADGTRTGFSGITLTTQKTTAGIPLEYYEGTLPVRAFGNGRGSPFEDVVTFPVAPGQDLEQPMRLAGRFEVDSADVPEGWYRPHIEVFAKLKGSDKVLDLRHLGISMGRWVDDRADTMAPFMPKLASPFKPVDMKEFLKDAQVLPNVKVGAPKDPRLIFTLFSDVAASGQSGLMSQQDQRHAGVSNRSRFPTPFVLPPGRWSTTPNMPAEFPSAHLAGLFQGFGSLTRDIESWLDLGTGSFTLSMTGPDGKTRELGTRRIERSGFDGLGLSGGPFPIELFETGEYLLQLEGCFEDIFGRKLCGGGIYELTCALPMSFSTAVKPGTNFFVGARYPAIMDINPAVAAHVRVDIDWYPNSDDARWERWTVEGDATHFGYFAPETPPPTFDEPGEYASLLTVEWTDRDGNLWLGQQASAGVVAPTESEVRVGGARTFLFDPHPELPELGSFDRYVQPFEGGSSFAEHSNLSLYDHTFPYHSGDTLYVSTTYPLESVIGPTLSMAADSPAMVERFEDAFLGEKGELAPYPMASRHHTMWYLPHIFKIAEDNFSYHRMVPGEMAELPILGSSEKGWSPYAWPEHADLEAYTYLSVIRPGLPVLSLAFSGSFMAPCWIISPNDYGYRFHSSPNGDLPEDIYRVMAGLVVKDKTTGETHYDAYSSAIRILPSGSEYVAVQPPGEIPVMEMAGRDHFTFLGLNTSGVYEVGHDLLLGGTLMPPAPADVTIDVTWPSGKTQRLAGRANDLGGFKPPAPIHMDEPGVYEVDVDIVTTNQAGEEVHGDVVGSGDGKILYFALPEGGVRWFASPLPALSTVTDRERVEIPLGWHPELEDVRLYWSVMTPGSLFDEGFKDLEGSSTDFVFRPRQTSVQLPNYDSVDFGTGTGLLTDIMVFVFYMTGTKDGVPVHDALRVVMRGDHLINPDAMIQPEALARTGIDVGEAWGKGGQYPPPTYKRDVDLDGLKVTNRNERGGYGGGM